MDKEIKVPVIGTTKRKWVYVAGAAVAVIVGYVYISRSRNAGTVTVDPALGSMNADGTYTNPHPVTSVDTSVDTTDGGAITTNDQWGTLVIADLTQGELEWDPTFVATAIGRYLAGEGLNSDEANVVRVAWARRGRPPVGNPQIILLQTGPAPGSGDPTPPPPPPPPAPPTPAPAPPRRYVIVRAFTRTNPPWQSTLSGIAGHSGRTVGQLASWNGVAAPAYVIHTGQKIWADPPGTYLGSTQIG